MQIWLLISQKKKIVILSVFNVMSYNFTDRNWVTDRLTTVFSRYHELWPLLADLFLYTTSPKNILESLEKLCFRHLAYLRQPIRGGLASPTPRSGKYDNTLHDAMTEAYRWQHPQYYCVHSFRYSQTVVKWYLRHWRLFIEKS